MNMPRLTYFTGVALLALCGAFLLTDALLWQPGVTERNSRCIRTGMTEEQVETLLDSSADFALTRSPRGEGVWMWSGPKGHVLVRFSKGRVYAAAWLGGN
jgi:hypothetical protein